MRVQGGEVAPGPGGDPAAQGGELKRLGEVAQRQPVVAQLVLQVRAERPALDAGGQGHRIDLHHAVQALEVDRDHAAVAGGHRGLHAAHHAGPAAERDHGRAGSGGPLQHGLDLLLTPGVGHDVRDVIEPAAKRSHDVAVGPAIGVQSPLVGVLSADLIQPAGRPQPGRRQAELGQANRLLGLR